MVDQKQTKTALDPTFYQIKDENGIISNPPYPLH